MPPISTHAAGPFGAASRRPVGIAGSRSGRTAGCVVLALATLGGCRYYEVTRSDGTTERISRAEYEALRQTGKRLGNVPSTRIQRQAEPAPKPED
ncbi:hypothetical protein [Phycisphaera mikurensis]|uniref:Uncharacterized protein n=1 Tax=Phycisphaera mikurensis (strain NBRC 102666 / KCTC 22515 / FYK2301M01) TaxID=1142394 RepID=I0IFD5_PHYMF|nr:hypothetical protein [Phycisphaera mikurensis]MBB6440634.1 hypothetical protein [Phycisphaera mikurensis]BAM03973.1 hypothetical protein PSMK_18140 [Phycisphaera mikurensis NBRC 102666]